MDTHVRDNLSFLHDPPSCRVYNSANISIPNDTVTALTFDSERFDTDTMHSTSTNTGRITFTTAGKYLVGCNIAFAADADGRRLVEIVLNGTTVIATHQQGPVATTGEATISLGTLYSFAAADYATVRVYQNGGAALNVTASANYSPEFWATWVSG